MSPTSLPDSFVARYELEQKELELGLRTSRRFRRQLGLLALLAVPSFIALSLWPAFRWWMLPPLGALLAYRALQVPARAARRALAGGSRGSAEVVFDRAGVRATGIVEATAPWSDVTALAETAETFVLDLRGGPVLVVPKRELGQPQQARLRERASQPR